ncbi:ATP-binding protein [Burkholderia cenocepacia]|uniref:ATP-binding protein n=1 Tax=Burkholderia cenocepacia TaxID=95486 RepID=UPI002656E7AF|nr:ATP-binding protein [Burkholderia cenocepacia]MDN7646240.1 ATP-binding protein [Burkholderia cenocepacia]
MPHLRQTLRELRRYHRFLMAGGRWAAVLGILIALLAEGLVLIQTYAAGERQMFTVAHRLVQGRIAANEESFLSVLARAELSWDDEREVPQNVVERFRENGNLLYWKPFPAKSLKLLIAGAPGVSLDDALIERYFQLARQIGRANIGESKVLGRQLTQVFFSPDQKIVAILPASAIDRPERLDDDAGRASFMKEVTGGTGYLADEVPPSPHERRLKVYWSRQLYPLPDGRKMVRLTSPVISDDKVEAILVNEVDPRELIVPVVGGTYDGIYAIVDEAGEIAATAASNGSSSALSDLVTRWRRSHSIDAGELVEQHADGRSMLAQRLGDTGYTLIYTYSWWDIVAAVWGKAVTAAVLLSTVLAVVWLLLFQLNRRVFLPMYARAKEVFESERLSRTVIETVPIGIGLVSTGSGELLYGGSAMKALAEIVDGGMPRLLAELSMRYARLRLVQRDSSAGPMFHEDVTLRTLDGGEIGLQIRFTLGRYLGEDVLVAAFVDVTASQRLARQLHAAKEAADQANAAKSAFLATMSHEIRTPLNAILGNLELLAHSQLHPSQRDRLRTICMSSNGLLAIIENVLDFSKIEAGRLSIESIPFDPATVVSEVAAIFEPVAQAKGLQFDCVVADSLAPAYLGDPIRVQQIASNLLSNAIKFTDSGDVLIEVYAKTDAAACTSIVIGVIDSGIGMNEAQLAHLFQPFVQADSTISRRFGGTGLGLALCRRLVDLMGGTLDVRSTPGEGSQFVVVLPFEPTTAVAPSVSVAGPAAREGTVPGEWRVLAVDDQPSNRELIRMQLDALGYKVDLAEEGGAALRRFTENRYNILLTDLSMPGMDGYALAGCLRAQGATLPIVAMTAHAEIEEHRRCAAAGIDAVLVKPVLLETLDATLRRLLRAEEAPSVAVRETSIGTGRLPDAVHVAISESTDSLLASLREAISAEDAAAMLRDLHALRGTFALIREQSVVDACAEMEEACRRGELAGLPADLDRLVALSHDTLLRRGA